MNEKIVCQISAGKLNFMGFSVHNENSIGRAGLVCSKKSFIYFQSTVLSDGGQNVHGMGTMYFIRLERFGPVGRSANHGSSRPALLYAASPSGSKVSAPAGFENQ